MSNHEKALATFKALKLRKKKREIDINNCVADSCQRAWNSQRSGYRVGQR